jgi:tungstate transport system permease protein
METSSGLMKGFYLLFSPDGEVLQIALLSLKVSFIAVLVALAAGIPAALLLAGSSFPGRKMVITFINTAMSLPPVLAGLVVYLLFCRSGPLGDLNLIYTPSAIIIAQVIIALPVVTGLALAAFQSVESGITLQARGLGASPLQVSLLLLREARYSGLAALMAAYGAVISEVGAVMIVGGDIRGETRVLTTALVLETRRGNFEKALALGIVLLLISFAINLYFTMLQQKAGRR